MSVLYAVSIRTENNLSSVKRGGTLRITASGRGLVWTVSSTPDGTGPVAPGTGIDSNGLLTVAANETAIYIYIIVISTTDSSRGASSQDTKQIRVVDVTGVNVSPQNASVTTGRTQQFAASVIGNNSPDGAVTWKVSSNTTGTGAVTAGTSINASGLLTVAANETLRNLIVTATSVVDPSVWDSVSVTVLVPTVTSVTVNPANQSVRRGATIQFSATVVGTNDPVNTVTWRVSSNASGTGAVTSGTSVNVNGLLTVSANETATPLYVIATSTADTTKSGVIAVNVVIPIVTGVTVSPANQTVTTGGTMQFSATVTGTNISENAVTWRVSSNAAGTGAVIEGTSINANGLLTVAANETARALYIFATSVEDQTKFGSTPVNVTILTPTVTGVTISPLNSSVGSGGTLQFSASVTGTNNPSNSVTWRVSSNAAGTGAVTPGTSINANGLLTVSANETLTTLFVFATSTVDTSKSTSVAVSVVIATAPTAPVPVAVTAVTVSPSNQSVQRSGTLQFSASVTGTGNPSTAVTWRVSSNAAGTGAVTPGTSISAGGLLTISANETLTTLYVTAASSADTSKSGSAAVSVLVPTVTGVTVSPSNQSLQRGGTAQFSASVTGTGNPNNAVTWRVSSNAAGTGAVTSGTSINTNGLLTVSASETSATLYIFATSTVDTSKSGSAVVSVLVPTVTGVTVSPSNPSVQRGRTQQFSASVTGTNNPSTAVTWRVSSNAAGTGAVTSGTSISANGLLTISANETATNLYVAATSTADTSRSGSATVRVTRSQNEDDQGEDNNSQGQNQQ
jgi:hypothetical protein